LTLSLILRFNLKFGGYSIWSAIFIAPHIKEDLKLLGAYAPHSLEAAKEVLKRHLQDEVSEGLEDDFKNTRKPTVLGYEELGGLSDPGLRDCAHSIYSGIRDGVCPIPYIYCNYLLASSTSRNRRKLPEQYSGRTPKLVSG
jgi:hypothetical protein